MAAIFGIDCVLNYKIDGQGGAGSWIELTNVTDVEFALEKNESDATTRATGGWEAIKTGLKKGSVDFEIIWDLTDAGFQAFKDAFLDGNIIGCQILDDSDEGLQADFEVVKFSRTEPLKEVVKASVTIKVAYSATPPSWLEAA